MRTTIKMPTPIVVSDSKKMLSDAQRRKWKSRIRPDVERLFSTTFETEDHRQQYITSLQHQYEDPQKQWTFDLRVGEDNASVHICVHPISPTPSVIKNDRSVLSQKLRTRLRGFKSLRQSSSCCREGTAGKADQLYYQLITRQPALQTTLPRPSVIRQQATLYQSMVTQPIFQDGKYALLREYWNACLSLETT